MPDIIDVYLKRQPRDKPMSHWQNEDDRKSAKLRCIGIAIIILGFVGYLALILDLIRKVCP